MCRQALEGFGKAPGRDHKSTLDRSYRFNQSLLLRLKKHFSLKDISATVEAVVAHHPMLRARFGRGLNG
jgi:hypothetical protein